MESKVREFIKQIGFESAVDEKQINRVKRWLDWYQLRVPEYSYLIYNGKTKTKKYLKSLSILTQACGDLSDFFFNEKLDITIDKKKVDKIVREELRRNNFLSRANKLMQLTKALGTGAIVPYLDHGKVKLNFFNANNIVILESDGDEVKSVLFHKLTKNGNNKTLKINAHIYVGGGLGYVILNRIYKKYGDNGDWVEEFIDEKLRTYITYSDTPQFAMLFTPEVNNEDIESPYGISCYADALDIVISLDRAYDSYDNELWLGRKRVYVKGSAATFNTSSDGKITPVFDPSDTTYYQIPGGDKDPAITESKFELRIDEIKNALQGHLNLFSSKVGLGHNYYKFQDGEVYVNTDNVISSNSDVYRKIQKQENIITHAIDCLCHAIAELMGIKEKFSVSVFYDDTIIEDTKEIRLQAQSEYNNKLISKVQYYKDVYKLNDKEAEAFAKTQAQQIEEFEIIDGSEPIE